MMDDHREEFYEVRSPGGHSAVLQRLVDRHINAAPFRGSHSSTREFLFNTVERPAASLTPSSVRRQGLCRVRCRSPGISRAVLGCSATTA